MNFSDNHSTQKKERELLKNEMESKGNGFCSPCCHCEGSTGGPQGRTGDLCSNVLKAQKRGEREI